MKRIGFVDKLGVLLSEDVELVCVNGRDVPDKSKNLQIFFIVCKYHLILQKQVVKYIMVKYTKTLKYRVSMGWEPVKMKF